VFADPRFHEQELVLRPQDSLVLYTDGITEARLQAGMLGHAGLAWLLGEVASAEPEGIADHTLGHVLGAQNGRPRDDIALLVARARAPGDGGDEAGNVAGLIAG
jgi:serine phosphatase RsbU (regulator of sigma subunit)